MVRRQQSITTDSKVRLVGMGRELLAIDLNDVQFLSQLSQISHEFVQGRYIFTASFLI